ncbi:MAG: hypothetical protein U0M02_00535 [Acutalibacteraceae bacterium]|nr:hypothetical protein [Acutalibacteraceae bacterium]
MNFAVWFSQNFCVCGWIFAGAVLQKIQFVYTAIGTSGYPKGENLLLAHDFAFAKSSVLYLCSGGGEKDGCRPT